MWLRVALALLLGLPAAVAGQSVAGGAFAPLPPIGLPLPEIGLPLPMIGLPPAINGSPRVGGHTPEGIGTEHRRHGRRGTFQSPPIVVYLVPAYGWDYPTFPSREPRPAPPAQEPATGRLRLDVEPKAILQVYVDSYYVGIVDDLNGELTLEAGPHTIELRAPGYEALTFDVKIVAKSSITYRGALEPEKPRATDVIPAAVIPATPPTFYFIPGCYVGNVPPKEARLPATCDASRVITYNQ